MAKTCCCLKLPMAALVVGILHLTILVISLVHLLVFDFKRYFPGFHMDEKQDILLYIRFMLPFLLSFIACFLLLIGIIKKRAAYLLPWLILFIIYETFEIISTVMTIYKIYEHWQVCLALIAYRLVHIYCFYVICSLYSELKVSSRIKSNQTAVEALSD